MSVWRIREGTGNVAWLVECCLTLALAAAKDLSISFFTKCHLYAVFAIVKSLHVFNQHTWSWTRQLLTLDQQYWTEPKTAEGWRSLDNYYRLSCTAWEGDNNEDNDNNSNNNDSWTRGNYKCTNNKTETMVTTRIATTGAKTTITTTLITKAAITTT